MRWFYFCNLWELPLLIFSSTAVYSQLNRTTGMEWQVVNCLGEFSYQWQQTDQHKAGSFYLNTTLGVGTVLPYLPGTRFSEESPLFWMCILLVYEQTPFAQGRNKHKTSGLIFKSHPGCTTNCTEHDTQAILSLSLQITSFPNSFTATFQVCPLKKYCNVTEASVGEVIVLHWHYKAYVCTCRMRVLWPLLHSDVQSYSVISY